MEWLSRGTTCGSDALGRSCLCLVLCVSLSLSGLETFRASGDLSIEVCGMKYTWPDFSKCFGKESSRELKKEGVAVVNCIKDVFSSFCDVVRVLRVLWVGLTSCADLLAIDPRKTSSEDLFW